MVTKTKAPTKAEVNKIVAKQVKKVINAKAVVNPVAKALIAKAPARTQTQEKVVTKAIQALKQPKVVVMTPVENKKVEKKLDTVMKTTQVVMKKEIVKAPARTPAQEKEITAVIKDLKSAKKPPVAEVKKVVKAKPAPKPVFNKIPTKDLLKDMERNIAKTLS